jgi:hypothetical protein
LCKHFRWCHQACLISVSDGNECCQDGDHGLSATYVSLKKAVHLAAALHVVSDLGDDSFLSSCQREWKGVIAFVECISDLRHPDALFGTASDVFLLQQRKLKVEQLLEFQPVFSLFGLRRFYTIFFIICQVLFD